MTGLWNTVPYIDYDGDYSQSAIGNTVGRDLTQNLLMFMRGQPAWTLGRDEVARRLACYVPSGNHEEVVRLLRDRRAIVLTGRPGSGRSTTAIAAMNALLPHIPVRWFFLGEEDVAEISHGGARGYLVRASDGQLGRLGSCFDALHASGSYLAVLADGHLTEPNTASLTHIAVEPPSPLLVYRRWIQEHHRLRAWASWEQAKTLLRGALPADARRLADVAAKANRHGGFLEERQAEAAQEYLGWDEDLCAWFKKNPQPHDRALLIAAATLPSGDVSEGYVYAAASLLAGALRADINGGGLAWCPVTGLRDMLEVSPNDGEITFHRTGFAHAVLRHVLADYPLADAEVLTWLSRLPTEAAKSYGRANEAAGTFADLAAEHGADEPVTEAAQRWGQENLQELAFIALSRTCLDSRIGGKVRTALYDWSRTKNTPQTLKLVIAKVCELVGREYPSVALTRLKHLATRGNQQVVEEVLDVSMTLANAGQRSAVTEAAVRWCGAGTGEERLSVAERRRRRRAGAMLFLKLAQADAASASIRDADQAWRAVFEFLPAISASRNAVEATICFWLDYALSDDNVLERICTLFVDAARPTGVVSARLADETIARAVIDVVQRWAAVNRDDITRTYVERLIVVPLSHPWWLRVVRRLVLDFRGYRQGGLGSRVDPFG